MLSTNGQLLDTSGLAYQFVCLAVCVNTLLAQETPAVVWGGLAVWMIGIDGIAAVPLHVRLMECDSVHLFGGKPGMVGPCVLTVSETLQYVCVVHSCSVVCCWKLASLS